MKIWRRTYLVNRNLQMRYSMIFTIIALAGHICSVIIFNTLALRKLDAIMWSTHIAVTTTAEVLNFIFVTVNAATFFFTVVLSILSGIWMIRNASGPLYRMTKDINTIADGDLSTTVSLREKDEFRDVAESLNMMTGRLRARFVSIDSAYNDISRILTGLERSGQKEPLSAKDYEEVSRRISDIKAQLETFQL